MIKLTNSLFRLDPDIYFAENMADYLENASKVKVPLMQKFFPLKRIYVVINNVFIERVKKDNYYAPSQFKVHDETGEDIMRWDPENPLCYALHSFEEAQEKQFLKDKDLVEELFFRHYTEYDFSHIIEVNKYKKKYFQREPLKKLEVSLNPLL